MDSPGLDLDEVFLDAVEAVVLAALERIGDDPEARYRFFRRLLAVAQEEGEDGGGYAHLSLQARDLGN